MGGRFGAGVTFSSYFSERGFYFPFCFYLFFCVITEKVEIFDKWDCD